MPGSEILIEICVESVTSAVAAQAGGATRVELCRDLVLEGVTPPVDMVREARRLLRIPLHVLIRPRPGDFVYSEEEIERIQQDLLEVRNLGADGVAIGILRENGSVDRERMAELVNLARPMSVTFHRAFDVCADRLDALDVCISLGIERVLTSGGAPDASNGVEILRKLVTYASGKISIIAAGGINAGNLWSIVAHSGAREVHVGRGVSNPLPDSGGIRSGTWEVDEDQVRSLVALAGRREI